MLFVFAVFFVAAGMALFHGIYYLEVNSLSSMPSTEAYINREAERNNFDYVVGHIPYSSLAAPVINYTSTFIIAF